MRLSSIMGIVAAIGLLIMFGGMFMLHTFEETETIKTDCYDRHNNKIIGAECESKHAIIPEWVSVMIAGGFGLFFLGVAASVMASDY